MILKQTNINLWSTILLFLFVRLSIKLAVSIYYRWQKKTKEIHVLKSVFWLLVFALSLLADCVLKFPPTYSAQVTSPVYLPARGTVKCEYILNGFTGVSEKVLDMSFTTFTVTDGSVNITGAKQAINLTGERI